MQSKDLISISFMTYFLSLFASIFLRIVLYHQKKEFQQNYSLLLTHLKYLKELFHL